MSALFHVRICENTCESKGFNSATTYPVLFISDLPDGLPTCLLIPNDLGELCWLEIGDVRFVRKD